MQKNNRYVELFRHDKKAIAFITIFMLLESIANFIQRITFSEFISVLSKFHFTRIPALIIAIFLLNFVATHSAKRASLRIVDLKNNLTENLEYRLAGNIANASPETVKGIPSVELAGKIDEGANFAESIIGIFSEIFCILLGIVAVIYTAIQSPIIGLVLLLSLFVIYNNQKIAVQKMSECTTTYKGSQDKLKAFIINVLTAFPAVKSQSLYLKSSFIDHLDKELDAKKEMTIVEINNSTKNQDIMHILLAIMLSIGAFMLYTEKITFRQFTDIFLLKDYIFAMSYSILKISRHHSNLRSSIERMNSIFEYTAISREEFGNCDICPTETNISIQNLTVSHNGVKILHDVKAELPANSFVGIVGGSGSGKSTLLNVIAHQEQIDSGEIHVGNINLQDLSESAYRKLITLAPQTPFIFNFSLKKNLLLANRNATEQDMWMALKRCSADEFVRKHPDQLNMMINSSISGGEKQRLALARIALRSGKILLLDESTSALDPISQEGIIQSVQDAVYNGRTVIMVAHRISTLKNADLILLMENGTITERGSYSDLMKNSEKFRRLAHADMLNDA